jgi:hypothetical protein
MGLEDSIPNERIVYILCVVYVIAVALVPPASEYEPSIYEGVPIVVWFLLAMVLSTAVWLLVTTILSPTYDGIRPAIVLIFTGYLGFFLLPTSRGYYLQSSSGSDIWSHIGTVSDVINTGYIPDTRYPATNILASEIALLTDISMNTLRGIFAFFFFALAFSYATLLVRSHSKDRELTACTILAAAPLVFSGYAVSYLPWLFALSLIFILLYTFHKYITTADSSWFVIGIGLCLALTWYHPITMAFGLIALIVQSIVYLHFSPNGIEASALQRALPITSVGVLSLMTWYVVSGRIEGHIASTILSLLVAEPGGSSRAETEASYTLGQTFSYFVLPEVGIALLYCGISGFVFLLVAGKYISKNYCISTVEGMTALQGFVGAIIAAAFFVVEIHGTNPLRVAQYLIIFSIFATALLLHYSINRPQLCQRQKQVVGVIAIFVISIIVLFGAATAYDDENHMTEASVEAYSWHLDTKIEQDPTYSNSGRDRYGYYHFGYTEAQQLRSDGFEIRTHSDGIPNRLGYGEYQQVSEWTDGGYLLIRDKDLTTHQVEPEWRLEQIEYIHPDDYLHLHSDHTASKLYDNGDTVIWDAAGNQSVDSEQL